MLAGAGMGGLCSSVTEYTPSGATNAPSLSIVAVAVVESDRENVALKYILQPRDGSLGRPSPRFVSEKAI